MAVPDEAETVRQIFEVYARLGSLSEVQKELRQRGIVSKRRTLKDGRKVGGIDFSTASLHEKSEMAWKVLSGVRDKVGNRGRFYEIRLRRASAHGEAQPSSR